jgi:hypothetical protein
LPNQRVSQRLCAQDGQVGRCGSLQMICSRARQDPGIGTDGQPRPKSPFGAANLQSNHPPICVGKPPSPAGHDPAAPPPGELQMPSSPGLLEDPPADQGLVSTSLSIRAGIKKSAINNSPASLCRGVRRTAESRSRCRVRWASRPEAASVAPMFDERWLY